MSSKDAYSRDDVTHVLEEGYFEQIEACRTLWENTRNPLYVWQAIGFCFSIGAVRKKRTSGAVPKAPWSECEPFPKWCLEYLFLAACRLDTLSEGKDFRKLPEPFGAIPATLEAWSAARDLKPHLSPEQAADLSLWALGIRRSGANAFGALRSLEAKKLDLLGFLQLREEGKSRGEALATLADETGIEDVRTVEKRISEVRQAYVPKQNTGGKT